MKKILLSFMLVFSLSILFAISVKASVTTSEYRNIVDMSSGGSYLLLDVDDSKPTLVVFIEDTCDLFFLRNDGSAGKFYFLQEHTSNVGNDVEFYDSSLNSSCSSSSVLWYYGGQRSVNLPYGIYYPSTMNVLGNFKAVYPDVKYATINDFVSALSDAGSYENYLKGLTSVDYNDGRLPLPIFNVKQAFTVGDDGGTVKYTWEWSASQHELYANNPNKYFLQMVASAKYTESGSDALGTKYVTAEEITFINDACRVDIDTAIPIYKEKYSFLESNYRKRLCEVAGVSVYDSSSVSAFYYVFVRVICPETEQNSVWKVYKCQGRSITPQGFVYDEKGNQYEIDEKDTDTNPPNFDANFDTDPTTDDVNSPTSPSYNDGAELDARHLLNNLEEIVETLKGIPELFQKIFLWMPNYLIVLIVTSIGLIVVVGFVKMLLR